MGDYSLRTDFDPLEEIWTDRPSLPMDKVVIQPLKYAGETAASKLQRIRKALQGQGAEGMVVTALDDIAWTLNLRGSDVHCNPVFVSYLVITQHKATLYINLEKITPEITDYLRAEGVGVAPYHEVLQGMAAYDERNILLDADQLNENIFHADRIEEHIIGKSPIPAMKAVKNAQEIAGFHNAMVRDGVAMVKFLKWLRPAVELGGQTEMSLDKKLTSLRAEQPLFKGISFDTIVGYEAHGAIVHYEATPETDVVVEPHGLVLIDSGAQYMDGTTDITRTIALGPVTDEQRKIYTLVLKGTYSWICVSSPLALADHRLTPSHVRQCGAKDSTLCMVLDMG